MDPEIAAIVAVTAYAICAAMILAGQIRRCTDGWQAWLLYTIARLYVPVVFHWRANQRCPFPVSGSGLIIANHRSPADPLLVWTNHHLNSKDGNIRVISFLTAREYCEQPGLRFICRNMRSIPTERDGKDTGPTREALRRLKKGRLLGIFPEGRINTGSGLLDANPGVAWLALRAQVPIFPVFIHDAPQGNNMVAPFCTFCRVRVNYGDPIDLSEYYDRRKSHETLQEVTDLLMSKLEELGRRKQTPADSTVCPKAIRVRRLAG